MHKDVDTHTLRKALWNYIHCLYGIRSVSHTHTCMFITVCVCAPGFVYYTDVWCVCRYDDYDYGEVNVLLERGLKMFVKTVACHPEQTTDRIYSAYWRLFRHSEKVRATHTRSKPSLKTLSICIYLSSVSGVLLTDSVSSCFSFSRSMSTCC